MKTLTALATLILLMGTGNAQTIKPETLAEATAKSVVAAKYLQLANDPDVQHFLLNACLDAGGLRSPEQETAIINGCTGRSIAEFREITQEFTALMEQCVALGGTGDSCSGGIFGK